MKRYPDFALFAALLSFTIAGALTAAEECCPAQSEQQQKIQMTGDPLPEGHPPIDANAGDRRALPPGHPPMSGQSAPSGQLPSGHPPIDGMNGMQAPGPAVGSIAIKVVQGTEGAQAVGNEPVTVDLYQRGKRIDSITADLDANGVVILEDIEFTGVVQPVVHLKRSGAIFQTAGHPMAASKPNQMIRLNVYETTHEKPDWSIKMRHVLVRRMGGALHVTEMVAVSNPDDRAWIGPEAPEHAASSQADESETGHHATEQPTLVLPLPEKAVAFQAGPGLDACCAEVDNSTLEYYKPMMPGLTQVGYTYQLPVSEQGEVSVDLQTPVEIAQLMLFVPKDGMTVEVQGMEPGQSIQGKAMEVRVFEAASVKPTDTVSLSIGALDQVAQPQAEPAAMDQPKDNQPQTTKLIAGIGGGALLAGAVGVLLFHRGPKRDN